MQDTHLKNFIYSFFENITGISGELKDFTISSPTIIKNCNLIIGNALNKNEAFIDISKKAIVLKKLLIL